MQTYDAASDAVSGTGGAHVGRKCPSFSVVDRPRNFPEQVSSARRWLGAQNDSRNFQSRLQPYFPIDMATIVSKFQELVPFMLLY